MSSKKQALSFWQQQEATSSKSYRGPSTRASVTSPPIPKKPTLAYSAPSVGPAAAPPVPEKPSVAPQSTEPSKPPPIAAKPLSPEPLRRSVGSADSLRKRSASQSHRSPSKAAKAIAPSTASSLSKTKKKISLPSLSLRSSRSRRSKNATSSDNVTVSSPSSARLAEPTKPTSSSDTSTPVSEPVEEAHTHKKMDEPLQRVNRTSSPSPLSPKSSPHSQEKTNDEEIENSDELIVMSAAPVAEEKPAPFLSKDPRENIMWELYETEKAYVQDLQIMVKRYLTPIRESKLISPEDVNKIFSTVEMLLPLHQDLEQQLARSPSITPLLQRHLGDTETVSDPTYTVGRCFVTMSQYLKMYSQYCSNQQVANMTLQQLSTKNRAFEELVYELSQQPECRRLDLPAYLIKPMQRVCKYPLLLREAVKQTDATHEDYANLQKALELISATVGVINESKKTLEESETLLSIQHRMIYPKKYSSSEQPIIAPGRKLVDKGQCNYISHSYSASTVKWYLFNDLFILTTPRHQLKKYVPLNSGLLGHVKVEDFDYAFEVVHAGQDKIWLAWKKEADRDHLRTLLRDGGMIDRASEEPVDTSILHNYSSRPIPIPPGKFSANRAKQPTDMNSIIAKVESLSAKPSAPSPTPMRNSGSKSNRFVISSPSEFRKL